MIVCQFINARPDWAPSSLVYMVGINSAKLDVLELGMVYSVFAPVNDKCELVDNPIVAHVTLKHITGDLLGITDESGDMWNMIKIMTTDKISVERNKSGKMVISVIPGGQVAKDDSDDVDLIYKKFLNLITQKYGSENDDSDEVDDSNKPDESVSEADLLTKVSDDEPKENENEPTEPESNESAKDIVGNLTDLTPQKVFGLILDKTVQELQNSIRAMYNLSKPEEKVKTDNTAKSESEESDDFKMPIFAAGITAEQLNDLIAHRYESEKAYNDFCRRFNCESDESDDSDKSADEANLLTKVSDDKVVSDESDAQKLDTWQVDVLNKMRTLANAHRAQWGHPPIVMPNYTKMDKNDFDDEFNRLVGILSKSHPSAFYGATGVGRIIPSPYSIETKSLIESVNGVKVKSDSHRWGTTHDVLIRFDRRVTFPEVIQFLKVYTEWNPDSPDFRSVKVDGCNCKFTIANKNLHPLIGRDLIVSRDAAAREGVMADKITGNFGSNHSSCVDADENDEDDDD